MAQAVALGSLMGARGNSGVILSQLFRGMAGALDAKTAASPQELAQALREGVETAYKAVMRPVEGTMLTVAKAAAHRAMTTAQAGGDILAVWGAAQEAAHHTLARTPDLLPVLKQAGVVDAGGKGLVFVFDAGMNALNGLEEAAVTAIAPKPVDFVVTEAMGDIRYPYDAQFLIKFQGTSVDELRSRLEEYGDSLLVVGSPELARVHIHTDRPGQVLSLCLEYGSLSQVVIDNMQEQHANLVGAGVPAPDSPPEAAVPAPPADLGIVGVASGAGLVAVFKSLGLDQVIDGGPTMNPSTQDVAAAVSNTNAKRVIFLPNNANVILAAKQAKRLVGRRMYIVPTRNIPQGIAALLAIRHDADMGTNLKRAAKAVKGVKAGEVTYAVRKGKVDGHHINPGDVLGMLNGGIKVAGSDPGQVLYDLLEIMVTERDELITIFVGQAIDEDQAKAVERRVAELYGFLDVEVRRGDQELYYFIVAVE
ncbi:MAG TPA: hypothetical protein DCM14_03220 [Clostridiales bacterium UBA8153]|nr:hypothetical protein [Clostridiales bacterium UBA8153]